MEGGGGPELLLRQAQTCSLLESYRHVLFERSVSRDTENSWMIPASR